VFMTTDLIRFTQWGNPIVDDSDWEPDGVTLHVRFCEGGGAYHFIGIPAATLPGIPVTRCLMRRHRRRRGAKGTGDAALEGS